MNKQKLRKLSRPLRSRWFRAAFAAAGLTLASIAWNRHLNANPEFHLTFPPMPSGPNAYEDFARAAAFAEKLPNRAFGPQTGLSLAKDAAAFAQDAPAIQALRAGFDHPYRDKRLFSQSQTEEQRESSYYEHLRTLARTLAFETQERAKRGDIDGALEHGIDGIQMGATLPQGSGLYGRAVGISCELLSRKALWPIVDRFNTEQASGALQRLEGIDSRRDSLGNSFRREEQQGMLERYDQFNSKNIRDEYQTSYFHMLRQESDRGPSEQHSALVDEITKPKFRDWWAVATMNRPQFVANYAGWIHARANAASLPYRVASAAPLPTLDPLNRLMEMDFDDNAAIGKPYFKEAVNQTGNRLLQLSLALRIYRLRTGAYPSSLDALVSAGILPALPPDPFTQTASAPFGYHVCAGDDYRLYSVGPDGADDGGRPVDLTLPISSGYANKDRSYIDIADRGDWVAGAHSWAGEVVE